MTEISLDQFDALPEGSFHLLDMRAEDDMAYGTIPGAVHFDAESMENNPPERDGKTLVIFCKRGLLSVDVAGRLAELGYDAVSLEGGYLGWLMREIKRDEEQEICQRAEESIMKCFQRQTWTRFTKAIKEYQLISPGDKIAVCISGGKDSMLMAKLFQELSRHSKFPFEVKYLVMDPGYSPENRRVIEENARRLNVPIEIFESDIFEAVYTVDKSPCYLCARMRRGHLYTYAKELGCNKIALGHHYDDVIETILMGMLYGAQVQTMMPKLKSTNFPGMELIRPMYLIREDDIKAWRDYNNLHFIQCACRFTDSCISCGSPVRSKRAEVKALIRALKETNPDVEAHIFRSVENVNINTVIAYKQNGVRKTFLDWYDESDGAVTGAEE